jgi:23S rRNA (pseudouridine1915-N3)-methyltransferase
MQVVLLLTGKTSESYLQSGMNDYEVRLKPFIQFKTEILPGLKQAQALSPEQVKEKEGIRILAQLKPDDFVILLDEKGKTGSSREFAAMLQNLMNRSIKRCVFVVGGAFGFSPEVYKRANESYSLSKLTFSHQLVRLIFMEQLYRGMCILKNHPYHND